MSKVATDIPDWVRVLNVLRRRPTNWPTTSVLRELLAAGHALPAGWGVEPPPDPAVRNVWSATDRGLKALAVWETLNGAAEDESRRQARPGVTAGKVMSWASVVATFPRNSPPERAALEAICNTCDKVKTDATGNWCGECGCGVSAYDRQIFNLASFKEPPGVRLCKHPERGTVDQATGRPKGWPLPVLKG